MKVLIWTMLTGCFFGPECRHGWREVKGVRAFSRVSVGCEESHGDIIPWRATTITVVNSSSRPLVLYVDGRRAVDELPAGGLVPIRLRNLTDYAMEMEFKAASWDGRRFTHETERLFSVSGFEKRAEVWTVGDLELKELPPPRPAVTTRRRLELQVQTPLYGISWNTSSITVVNQTSYTLKVFRDGRLKAVIPPAGVSYIRLPSLSGGGASYSLVAQAHDGEKIIGIATYQTYVSGYYQSGQTWTVTKEML